MKAAMSEICAAVRLNLGMPGRGPSDVLGRSSSPFWSLRTISERIRLGPPSLRRGVRPVAEGALGAVDSLAALDYGGIGRRALRIGAGETAASSRPTATASAGLRRRLRGRSLREMAAVAAAAMRTFLKYKFHL